jgi:hypothetical protein
MKNVKIRNSGSNTAEGKMSRISVACLSLLIFFSCLASHAFAVPETSSVRITGVTTSSFSVVWMTDVAAKPTAEIYSDSAMMNQITGNVVVTPMPASSQEVVQAAKSRGIMKVRVSGLVASTKYYVRTVTRDPSDPSSVAYSPLFEVVTASRVAPYRLLGGSLQGFSNDLVSFRVYIRPLDTEAKPGLGDLVILESEGSSYPLSTFVGEGITAPEGVLDLNNLFGADGVSLDIMGREKIVLRIYRGGGFIPLPTIEGPPWMGTWSMLWNR